MRRILAVLWMGLFVAVALAANPPSILNNSTHEVYQDQANFAALGVTCNNSSIGGTCSTQQPPSSTVLAINQTGSGVNLAIVPPETFISDAMSISTPEYGVEGTTPLTPVVTYQVIGQSTTGYYLGLDQAFYATLQSGGIVYSMPFCGFATSADYPPLTYTTVLPNTTGAQTGNYTCGYGQGIEFSIASTGGTWTPINSGTGSMDVSSPSATQNAMQVVLSALKLQNSTWTWFDIKAALRQTASNWSTGWVTHAATGTAAYGYGNISWTGAAAIASTSSLYLQPPGMMIRTLGGLATIKLFPFRQTRRSFEVVYAGGTWPANGCNGHGTNGCEYTTADITASGATLIYTSNGTDTTPMFTYSLAPVGGTVTFEAFTTDGSGNYSRIESFSQQSFTLSSGAFCVQ